MNPIDYLVKVHKFRITSNPNEYYESYNPNRGKKKWGQRDLWEWHNGRKIYHDTYCNGKHPAYDLSIKEGVDIPAVVDGIIVSGTSSRGNFGGTVVLADHEGDYQYIYGHVKNIQVKVGDAVKQGDILAQQSNTNYYNNPMNSHLHFQVQNQKYYADEKTFVCTGIQPENINVNNYTSSNARNKGKHIVVKGDTLYSLAQTYNTTVNKLKSMNNLSSNTLSIGQDLVVSESPYKEYEVKKNDTLWSVSQAHNTTVDNLKRLNNLKSDVLSIGQKLKVKSSPSVKNPKPPKKFDPKKNNKLSSSAYATARIDKLGAEVRKRKGNNFDTKAGYNLKSGDLVHIFQSYNGWVKIYSSKSSSNEWVWHERLQNIKTL